MRRSLRAFVFFLAILLAAMPPPRLCRAAGKIQITLTVLYDNTACCGGAEPDWGFACLVESSGKTVLFDAGAKDDILVRNAEKLKVDFTRVQALVISHGHGDHTGGIGPVLRQAKGIPVYFPQSASSILSGLATAEGGTPVAVGESRAIGSDFFLTGEMERAGLREQSLIIQTAKGLVILTGCSHQGIIEILHKARQLFHRDIFLVLGGFHLLQHSPPEVKKIIDQFKELGVQYCGATHCTGENAVKMFREAYGDHFVAMGCGRVLRIDDSGLSEEPGRR